MEKIKILLCFLLLFFIESCKNSTTEHNICDIDVNILLTLKEDHDVYMIRKRLDYYEVIFKSHQKMYISLNDNNFYYKKLLTHGDTTQIENIADFLRLCDEYKIKNLTIDENYYLETKSDKIYVYSENKPDSAISNAIVLPNNWYYLP